MPGEGQDDIWMPKLQPPAESMKFFVSPLDRLRRSPNSSDESAGRITAVQTAPCDRGCRGHEAASDEIMVIQQGDRTVVVLAPIIPGDRTAARQIGPSLIELLDDRRPACLVVDFARIGHIGSEGLNQLISVNSHARAGGIRLELTNLDETLQEVFRITRLDRLFDVRSADS